MGFGGTRVRTPVEKFSIIADDRASASFMATSYLMEAISTKANGGEPWHAEQMAVYWQEKAAELHSEFNANMGRI